MPILRLENVTKHYDKHTAVDHVSFDIPKGVVFGMLGPNGAGKTSLIRIITSITRADEGKVWMDGEPLNSRHPEQIGYMPEERGLYKKMKVGDHLTYLARLKGLSAADTHKELRYWFERFEIKDWWGKKVDELSKGMQQKVQFIATVLHKPKLLILDEPFSGLDPINTNLIKDEIRELNHRGTSIIFSTHRMEQVEEMCEHIVLINKGKNVLEGKVKDVRQQFKDNLFKIEYTGALPPDLDTVDTASNAFDITSKSGHQLTVKVSEGSDSNEILRHLIRQGVHIQSFNEILPTINEIFIKRVGESN
ncbi:MAG: ATP-binding cassette domain-containing protein [Lewinellaceae bacterium]|nr:ATP-binding cassette domain-containing protein [Saprospiraceae bacterium]MCB9338253.1 ATP-binding cassette domain-containing protein [Lewinellaceae bacterium]